LQQREQVPHVLDLDVARDPKLCLGSACCFGMHGCFYSF
jgi:hypothetical protein